MHRSSHPIKLHNMNSYQIGLPMTSHAHSFAPLKIRGRNLLPIVQGGMGVGISAHRLAGSGAREDALGTIASIDLRHHHEDLLAMCRKDHSRPTLERANLTALAREIKAARALSE